MHFLLLAAMDYQQTLDYLYSQLPMFTRIGAAAYKKDLHNTIALCNAFGNPERKFKSIHLAGTNGKGSTSHMLAAIFHQAGYKTGLYTSPHLKDFRERIKWSGNNSPSQALEMIPQEFVVDFTQRAQQLITDLEPSFFELTVAMAFDFFAQEKVDIAIVETGLGGRLDSTNIIHPELSIITNIGWDHMNILGDSLELIAYEKAGIIKHGVPVIIGETLPNTKPVFEQKASAEASNITFAEVVYEIGTSVFEAGRLQCEFMHVATQHIVQVISDLPGVYQQKNIRAVLTAIDQLRIIGYNLPETTVLSALQQIKKQTGLHGRWELIQEKPYVILDVGHNEDGIKQILSNIELLGVSNRQVRIVMGMVKDKDVAHVLQLFPQDFNFYFTNAHLPRALPAVELQAMAAEYGLLGNAYDDVNKALAKAKSDAAQTDYIIVCGSVFVVGEVETS